MVLVDELLLELEEVGVGVGVEVDPGAGVGVGVGVRVGVGVGQQSSGQLTQVSCPLHFLSPHTDARIGLAVNKNNHKKMITRNQDTVCFRQKFNILWSWNYCNIEKKDIQ